MDTDTLFLKKEIKFPMSKQETFSWKFSLRNKDKSFIRKGADLVYKAQISLLQALTGFKFVITHLDGRKLLVKNKEGEIIKPGQFKTIKEVGMPFFEKNYAFGNLYIDFEIVFPEKVNDQQMKELSKVLPLPKNEDLKNLSNDVESYFVTDYKIEEENTSHSGGNTKNLVPDRSTMLKEMKTEEKAMKAAMVNHEKFNVTINNCFLNII